METGGYLSLFTTGFGWYYSGILWQILAGTGLIFLPIIGIVIDHVISVRSQGSLLNIDADRGLAGLEVQFVTVLLVLLIAAVPTSLTVFSPTNDLQYTEPAGIFIDNARSLTPGDANSAYATGEELAAVPVTVGQISIPAWWYAVMKVSGGISHALSSSVTNSGEGYRAMKQVADTASISDPDLRNEINVMFTDCYAKALNLHQRDSSAEDTATRPNTDLPPQHEDIGDIDVHWIGSKYLYDKYYAGIHSRPVRGFNYNNAVDTQYDGDPGFGHPNCAALWRSIEQKIITISVEDGTLGIIGRARAQGVGNWSDPSAEFRREVAQMYIHNTPKNVTLTADRIHALKNQGDGFISNLSGRVGEAVASIGLLKASIVMELAVSGLISALVTVQAYLLMMLYIFIPVGMLVSRYSIGYLMSMGLLIFSIHMWPTIWTFAAWLDNHIAAALFGGQSAASTFWDGGAKELNKRIIHSLSVMVLYLSGPAVISWVLASAGSRVSTIASQASYVGGSGANISHSAEQGAIGGAGRYAGNVASGAISRQFSKKG